MKKAVSIVLAAVLILGLAVPSLAYSTPDFSDLPSDNWAYAPVMRMADQGIIQGTGGGLFSPELKVSAAQFLTLVGRIVFPETKVSETDTWYGTYMVAAEANGLLTGTQVNTSTPEAEITRYDMAVVLRAAAKTLGKTETLAQQSQVADYGVIPNMYTEAVLAVYGMGLIKGDQSGSFNGSNTMQRNELATVIDRLVALKTPGGTITDPEKPVESEQPTEPEIISSRVLGWVQYNSKGDPQKNGIGVVGIPVELRYTEDNGATYTVIETAITIDGNGHNKSPGRFEYTVQIEKTIYDRYESGVGQFYFSAEATVNGQRYVTQDRRTDGKANIIPIKDWTRSFVDIVPVDRGETVDVPIRGRVEAITYVGPADGSGQMKFYNSGTTAGSSQLTNSTVKIYFDPLQEGVAPVLIWETTADGGSFNETMTIDTAYYRTTGKHYILEAEAVLDGQLCTCLTKISISLTKLMGKGSGEELGTVWWTITSDEYWEFGLRTPRFE